MPESPAPTATVVLSSPSRPLSSPPSRTPTPPHSSSSGQPTSANQQLPPACGAKQLSKLKRFLTTLQQFGSDISPEIGERVRSLVLALVNSHLSIEEFHNKLQEATNFPLRPFVIPFLKANLPLLQRELAQCASLAKQTPQQYFARHHHVLLSDGLEGSVVEQLNENGKRPSPDKTKEEAPSTKRHCNSSPTSINLPIGGGPIRLEDISLSRELREREMSQMRERVERERRMGSFNTLFANARHDIFEDEFKHVEHMLHCLSDMVDKTKRAVSGLQERVNREREDLFAWLRRSDIDKKTVDPLILRQTEERVADVKKRAEEAVNEVKRQAVAELQKAVSAAESKASELVHAERVKLERALADARKQATQDALTMLNQQEESNESCWNCGRKASETCSGCNVARYCGAFCQHKDWELHHRVCGQSNVSRHSQAIASATADSQTPRPKSRTSSPTPSSAVE
ncbi:DgyrCDS6535 [Dimorphilus gyrociliatus]|uniref:DgyrCDS6535 n=1 Tax=Dimorphilus gyrociliatus TaxID=2664684 RepID=A0A7I8VT37_9ANNE|nr:DgyrCDS6535 [Dimorphilus gyrociliatus]